MAKDPNDRQASAGDLGRAAIAAASGTTPAAPEHTVATGAAAPARARKEPAAPPQRPPAGSRSKWIWAGAGVAALAVAAVLAIVLSGGSGTPAVSTLSLTPVQQAIPPIPHRYPIQTVATAQHGGYSYRVMLDTVDAPHNTPANMPLPLYMTLMVKRGSGPFVTVPRRTLPPEWKWTKGSRIVSFHLDPQPDGSGQIDLSWFVHAGDQNDVTHYLGVGPQGIDLQS